MQPTLKSQIISFDKTKLNKTSVYFVSSGAGAWAPGFHSFLVVAGTPARVAKIPRPDIFDPEMNLSYFNRFSHNNRYAHIYYCGSSIMHAPYEVSRGIVEVVLNSLRFSNEIKCLIKSLEGIKFPSVEHFLRVILKETTNLSQKEIFERAAFPDKELQTLVLLNQEINSIKGAILPSNPNSGRRLLDRKLFEQNSTLQMSKVYPLVDPNILREVISQQRLFLLYMEEKAGIGKSVSYKAKLGFKKTVILSTHAKEKSDNQQAHHILSRFVYYNLIPTSNNPYATNCNKSSATILQKAEDLSAEKQGRAPIFITGATPAAVASDQRMFLWEPLKKETTHKNSTTGRIGLIIKFIIEYAWHGGVNLIARATRKLIYFFYNDFPKKKKTPEINVNIGGVEREQGISINKSLNKPECTARSAEDLVCSSYSKYMTDMPGLRIKQEILSSSPSMTSTGPAKINLDAINHVPVPVRSHTCNP